MIIKSNLRQTKASETQIKNYKYRTSDLSYSLAVKKLIIIATKELIIESVTPNAESAGNDINQLRAKITCSSEVDMINPNNLDASWSYTNCFNVVVQANDKL